jgi:hypothetical protein
MPVSNGRVDDSHQTTSLEDASNANEVLEPHTETSNNTNEVLEAHNGTSSNANEVLEPQTEISSKGDQIHSGLGKPSPSVTKLLLFGSIITCLIIACIYLLFTHIIIFRI